MSFVINALCFIFVAFIGVWAGYQIRKDQEQTQGKLVIVRDNIDGETYTALAMGHVVMDSLQDGDRIYLDVEVRQ